MVFRPFLRSALVAFGLACFLFAAQPRGYAAEALPRAKGALRPWVEKLLRGVSERAAADREKAELAAAPVDEPRDAPEPASVAEPPIPLPDGTLFVPRSFVPSPGGFDVVIHFHGAPRVVLEGAEHVGLDALVVVMNHGIGSGRYDEAYRSPAAYEALLGRIEREAADRGFGTEVRRVALSSWSAGYRALAWVLSQRAFEDPIDAVLVLDGIHATFADERSRKPNAGDIVPFVETARRAAEGELLFSVTHSTATPEFYASSTATADVLIGAAGAARRPADETIPEHLEVAAARGYLEKAKETPLVPTTEASAGCFRVRGYAGGGPEQHLAHFIQMGATVFPELAARWQAPRKRR